MANKKINQLVSKTAILSTDIFGIGDATTGQLFKKTIAELQAAIGGAVISVNGLVGTVVLDTDDIQELATPTNKYFTDARARGAISLTVTGNSGASTYSSGTGVLNVPTYTLAGLGGISATFLSGTSGISYNSTTGVISYSGTVYTDASIRALLSGSTGISYNSTTGAISYSGTVYTDSSVRALISITTTGDSGASTYNNTTGVINVPNYTLAGLGGISYTSLSGGTGITYNNTTGAISYSGTVYTDASVRALVSLTTTGTSGASTYNSTTGVFNIPQYQAVLTNPVTGTGTSGHVAYWNGSGSIAGSANHFWDNTNGRLGIGTSSPGAPLSVVGNSSGYTLYSIGRNNADNASVISFRSNSAATEYAWIESGVSNQLDFGTNGSYRMKITSAGNVGIGTTSPTGLLQLNGSIANSGDSATFTIKQSGTSYNNAIYIERSGERNGYFMYIGGGADALTFRRNYFGTQSDVMSLTRDGNVGIGTTSPSTILDIYKSQNSSTTFLIKNDNTGGSAETYITASNGTYITTIGTRGTGTAAYLALDTNSGMLNYDGNTSLTINATNASAAIKFTTNGFTERMRIASDGTVNVNKTLKVGIGDNPTNHVIINENEIKSSNNAALFIQANSSGKTMINVGSGNILLGTQTDNGEKLYVSGNIRATGSITANSDITLKKNLLKIENALEKVEQINGYTYELKEDDSKRHAGVIAQEIQEVLPEIVNKGNNGLLGVEYGNISALLIEAIKEQNIKIKNLETLLASK